MRIFTAGLSTETNTFAPWPTGEAAFHEGGFYPGNASASGDMRENLVARQYRDLAGRDGHAFVESLFATAEPSGPTVHAFYENMVETILADLVREGPFDVVLLWLHGAMVSTECDDCEADLVERIREVVGPETIIAAEHDPHCHVSERLLEAASLVILFKEYPHVDYLVRAEELYGLALKAARGEIRPVPALFDCQMIGFYPTMREPMSGLVRDLREAETRPGILSVSFVHGFPWGDTWETGSKMLVYADHDRALAAQTAEELGLRIYEQRHALLPRYPRIPEAIAKAMVLDGRVVLGDVGDNAGGGAPSDTVAVLDELIERRVERAAFGCIWDPIVAAACADAGVGTRLSVRLGGKCGPASGGSRDYDARIMAVREEFDQGGPGPSRIPMGRTVWLEIMGVDVVINSVRTQTFAPDAFTGLGIDLSDKHIIVVKSSQHFREHFEPISDHLFEIATPGAIDMAFERIAYRKRRPMPYFPAVDDPLGRPA
ncbi:M81 family metallopeptidase [Stakelama pacifica]|uniref:Microcystinase C n=1 Tax=Stakelama pacifica TaxID=517720 RepID=A0A4R6FB19_9SPHN|nr:M81 family metallopeptidase [Stakelama pacifica]TDN78262.1 microcystin degradation protein MlrC [Stakelama pacifica]GGO99770.1 microcystinase C [Stakelama pacifica]